MVVRREQPWKASIRTHSKECFMTIGMHLSSSVHALIIRTTTRLSIKCLAAAILTRWALFNTDAAPAEKHAESRSPASPAFVFPVPRCIPTAGQTLSRDDCCLSQRHSRHLRFCPTRHRKHYRPANRRTFRTLQPAPPYPHDRRRA